MAISDKIRALIRLKGKDHNGLAEYLDINSQSLSNKLSRSSFTASDLIKIAAFLECTLAFIVDDESKIVLTEDDLR